MIQISMDGASNLAANLKELSKSVRAKYAIEAAITGATPIVDAAQAHAKKSEDTGNLRASIGFRAVKHKKTGNVSVIIGPRRGFVRTDASGRRRVAHKYAHLVEFGHYSAARTGTTVAQLAKGTKGKSRRKGTLYEQMYILPKPFMRPAFASASGEAFRATGKALGERVEAAAKRLHNRRNKAGSNWGGKRVKGS